MLTEEIVKVIQKALPNARAYVFDPMNDNTHFSALVICDDFAQMPLVKQHQLVMNALKEKFASSVHALQLKTFTEQKWQLAKADYDIVE